MQISFEDKLTHYMGLLVLLILLLDNPLFRMKLYWSIAGGRPTDFAVNAPNAGGGGTIVAPGLRAGQVFHEFRTAYTTITAEKSKVAFQSIVQGKGSVTRFYSNLRRMVKLAYPTLPAINQEELVRQQFLQSLFRENQVEARCIGLENLTFAILKKLEEIERYRTDVSLSALYRHLYLVYSKGLL